MRTGVQNYPAEKARGATINLRHPWQKLLFFGGLAAPILLLLFTLLFPTSGH